MGEGEGRVDKFVWMAAMGWQAVSLLYYAKITAPPIQTFYNSTVIHYTISLPAFAVRANYTQRGSFA